MYIYTFPPQHEARLDYASIWPYKYYRTARDLRRGDHCVKGLVMELNTGAQIPALGFGTLLVRICIACHPLNCYKCARALQGNLHLRMLARESDYLTHVYCVGRSIAHTGLRFASIVEQYSVDKVVRKIDLCDGRSLTLLHQPALRKYMLLSCRRGTCCWTVLTSTRMRK